MVQLVFVPQLIDDSVIDCAVTFQHGGLFEPPAPTRTRGAETQRLSDAFSFADARLTAGALFPNFKLSIAHTRKVLSPPPCLFVCVARGNRKSLKAMDRIAVPKKIRPQ